MEAPRRSRGCTRRKTLRSRRRRPPRSLLGSQLDAREARHKLGAAAPSQPVAARCRSVFATQANRNGGGPAAQPRLHASEKVAVAPPPPPRSLLGSQLVARE